MLAVGFIPGLVGMASIYIMGKELFRQSTAEDLTHITLQTAANIHTIVNKEASKGMSITQHPDIGAMTLYSKNSQEQHNLSTKNNLRQIIKQEPYATYLIYDQTGELVLQLGSEIKIPINNTIQKPTFNSLTKQIIIGEPINSHSTNGFYLPIYTPIYSHYKSLNVKITGRMVTYLNIPLLLKNIRIHDAAETRHLNLITKSGTLIYHPYSSIGVTVLSTQAINDLTSGNKQSVIDIDEHGIKSLFTLAPLSSLFKTDLIYSGSNSLYIIYSKPTIDAILPPIKNILLGAAVPGFCLAFLLILSIYFALNKIVQPIDTLKKGAAIIGSGNLDHKIEIHTSDEIEDLANEFNKMSTALKASYANLEDKVQKRTVELQTSCEELEKASKLKSQFLSSMSHELRTPLNAIIGFSDILTEEIYGDINIKQRKYLNNIHQSGKHLLEVINNILDLSKIEADRMTLNLRELIVDDAITEIQNLVTELSFQAGVELSFHAEKAPSIIIVDFVRFRQIMVNLLGNAIKFTPKGGRIIVTIQEIDKNLIVSVKDTGIGILDEHIQSIFKPFRQADGSSSRNYEGTGLGLTLAKEFVEMHGGHLSVKSKFGEGSCFTFTLPMLSEHPIDIHQTVLAKPHCT